MFSRLFRKAAKETKPTSAAYLRQIRERYPPKKVWPPDFKTLSFQEQLNFEKRFKRRMTLASQRPKWDKALRLTQTFSITAVLTYTVLFMDFNVEQHPFLGIRKSIWGLIGYDYETSPLNPSNESHSQGLSKYK